MPHLRRCAVIASSLFLLDFRKPVLAQGNDLEIFVIFTAVENFLNLY